LTTTTDVPLFSPLQLTYSIHSVPGTGSLYQLSQVFSAYGYDPKNGALIPPSATVNGLSVNVTGSQNRVYYARPSYDVASNQAVRMGRPREG